MSKSAKIWHSKLIFYVKNHRNLSQFFFLEKYQSRSTFFDNINFYITLFSKIVSNFWQLATTPILKIQSFPLDPPLEKSTTHIAIFQGSVSHLGDKWKSFLKGFIWYFFVPDSYTYLSGAYSKLVVVIYWLPLPFYFLWP